MKTTFPFLAAALLCLTSGNLRAAPRLTGAEAAVKVRGAGGAGDGLYTRIAWSVSVNYHNLFESTAASWETMASGFTHLIAQHPESRWLQNAYARFAFLAHDPDMGIWVNLENVALARKLAAEEAVGTRSP